MKKKSIMLGTLALGALLLQGCIAFPPLVQVEHKDSPSNAEVIRRLDAIDHRLDQLDQKLSAKLNP
jgi:hypothetical protein